MLAHVCPDEFVGVLTWASVTILYESFPKALWQGNGGVTVLYQDQADTKDTSRRYPKCLSTFVAVKPAANRSRSAHMNMTRALNLGRLFRVCALSAWLGRFAYPGGQSTWASSSPLTPH